MRYLSALVLLSFALTVPPSQGVKVFLQKYAPVKNYMVKSPKFSVPQGFNDLNLIRTTSNPPHIPNFTRVPKTNISRNLKIIGIGHNYDTKPEKNSNEVDQSLNRKKPTTRKPPNYKHGVHIKEIFNKKHVGAFNKDNSGVVLNFKMPSHSNKVSFNDISVKENIKVPTYYKYEVPKAPTHNEVLIMKEIIGAPIKNITGGPTQKHMGEADTRWNDITRLERTKELQTKTNTNMNAVTTNAIRNLIYANPPSVTSPEYAFPANPPRLLDSIGDLFGFNVQTMWEGIKNIFSLYFSEEYIHSTPLPEIQPISSEDAHLNITQLVKKAGYNLEKHRVRTTDGYILTMYRLRNKLSVKGGGYRPVVFLMHGLVDSADSWVLQGPGRALAYLLADAGFDVWMGNARGSKYSLDHNQLSSKKSEFWKFTWEEIGLFDLSAMVDYTLAVTNHNKIYYVGHSQGSTCFFVLLSLRPEYNDKFERMFALSPVAYMTHVKSPIVKLFSPAHELLNEWFSNLNVYAPFTDSFKRIMELFCYLLPRCDSLLSMLVGGNYRHIKQSLLPVIFGHMPSGSSTLQVMHYGQLAQSGLFCRYDYGKESNLNVYGKLYPPEYQLEHIRVPISLFYSNNDWLAVPEDVNTLKSKLISTETTDHLIHNFNHLDFMYADNAKTVVYEIIVGDIMVNAGLRRTGFN